MTVLSVVLGIVLCAGFGWWISRRERFPAWKTALLILFCLIGGILGNLVLGWLETLSIRYLFISLFGLFLGAWGAYLLFKKLF